MANSTLKTGGYKDVNLGTDGFRGATASKTSYDGPQHKEVAPNVYKQPQMTRAGKPVDPLAGGKHVEGAHGYHVHTAKHRDGPLRNSGHPRASRIGKN